jgi:hypothetical protein
MVSGWEGERDGAVSCSGRCDCGTVAQERVARGSPQLKDDRRQEAFGRHCVLFENSWSSTHGVVRSTSNCVVQKNVGHDVICGNRASSFIFIHFRISNSWLCGYLLHYPLVQIEHFSSADPYRHQPRFPNPAAPFLSIHKPLNRAQPAAPAFCFVAAPRLASSSPKP